MKTRVALFLAFVVLALPGFCAGEGYLSSVKSKVLFKSKADAAGNRVVYPKNGDAEMSGYLVEIAAGGETGWHVHPHPCMAYVLSGSVEVEQEGGTVRKYVAGDSFVELINTLHNGRNKGTEPVRILLFVAGVEGVGPSVRK